MPSEPPSADGLRQLLVAAGHPVETLSRLTGDVSPRTYFRAAFEDRSSAILAAYPATVPAGCRRFLATTALLEDAGVRVPRILAADCGAGWMLVEDLGDATLYEPRLPGWAELLPYLHRAADFQQRIAELPRRAVEPLNPALDAPLLRKELDQTWNLCLEPRGLTGSADLQRRLKLMLDDLCEILAEAEPVPGHRDFMARNLVPVGAPPGLAVLDHQDLRLAPPQYDLASLLNDSLFAPSAVEEDLLSRWAASEEARRRYHLAAVQRSLKAAGTFESFALRGFPRHLSLVSPTLGRTLRHLRLLPQTASLGEELERLWAPLLSPGRAVPRLLD